MPNYLAVLAINGAVWSYTFFSVPLDINDAASYLQPDDVIQNGRQNPLLPYSTSKGWYMSEYAHPFVPITSVISQISYPSPTTRLATLSQGICCTDRILAS